MDDMDEIVQEFLIESAENLDQLDRDLLALEVEPQSRERLSSAFRTIHTIKGTSGFLAFNQLEQLTHTGESLLARLRDGQQTMDTPAADALLAMVDTVRAILASIEETGTEGQVDIADVVQRLQGEIRDDGPAISTGPAPTAEPDVSPPSSASVVASETAAPAESPVRDQPPAPTSRRSAADSSLRVDVDLLDGLMRLAGELVLARNQMVRGVAELADPALIQTAHRLNVITTDLQESIMKTRMQPVDHLWSKLPRMVRDLAAQCGRSVRLTMTGQDTELDRALLEAIKDPLTHLVRNCIDHGIENPDAREAAGKPREGTLALRAYHNSGQVVLEVSDDGAGIDPARIAAKALERGLRTAGELAAMSDSDILQLVFTPGFSTAAAVTNVSGRGVGMDVVKTNLEAIGGAIELESVHGQGTTCRMRVPLTLAIVPALTVACDGERFAIAQAGLLELVAVDAENAAAIEEVAGVAVYRLRGSLLPLLSLSAVLAGRPATVATTGVDQVIVVLQAGNRRFGLLVDAVINTEEIVVKALSPGVKNIGIYSGATILGDGRVALILDVQNLARRALRAEGGDRGAVSAPPDAAAAKASAANLLIAGVGDGTRVAIPMAKVTRLERMSVAAVQAVGNRDVVQYREQIIPLVRLDRFLGCRAAEPTGELPVAVYSDGDYTAALAIDEIVDIVEYDLGSISAVDDAGFVGSVVVRGQIMGLLDVEQAISAADPGFHARSGGAAADDGPGSAAGAGEASPVAATDTAPGSRGKLPSGSSLQPASVTDSSPAAVSDDSLMAVGR